MDQDQRENIVSSPARSVVREEAPIVRALAGKIRKPVRRVVRVKNNPLAEEEAIKADDAHAD